MKFKDMSLIINGKSNECSGSLIKSQKWLKLNQKFQETLNLSGRVTLETVGQMCAVCIESNRITESNLIRTYQCRLVI